MSKPRLFFYVLHEDPVDDTPLSMYPAFLEYLEYLRVNRPLSLCLGCGSTLPEGAEGYGIEYCEACAGVPNG